MSEKRLIKLEREMASLWKTVRGLSHQERASIGEQNHTEEERKTTAILGLVEGAPSNSHNAHKSANKWVNRGRIVWNWIRRIWNWVRGIKFKQTLEVIGILAGIGYAWVTYNQWQDQTRNFKVDERAWISSRGVGVMKTTDGNRIAVTFEYINSGKTPGYIDRMDTKVGIKLPWGKISWVAEIPGQKSGAAIPPSSQPYPLTMTAPQPLSSGEIDLLQTGKLGIAFDQTIYYHTIFGDAGKTRNCAILTGGVAEISKPGVSPSCGDYKME
jgi:hypothetical protein